jgi:hypothetical protein
MAGDRGGCGAATASWGCRNASGADRAPSDDRDRRLYLATFDLESLERRREERFDVPPLK